MDRQTDGQNYDSQDHASIAASRGKKLYAIKIIDTKKNMFRNEHEAVD